jgi:uncharacterized RDD family membrane protein YckC
MVTAAPWQRFLAALFDWAFILTFLSLFSCFPDYVAGCLAVLCLFLYQPILESSKMQATLGEYFLKIKVTSLQGERITIGRAFLRLMSSTLVSLIFWISFFTIILGVAYVLGLIAPTSESQAIEAMRTVQPLVVALLLSTVFLLACFYICLFFVRMCSKGTQTLQDYFSRTLLLSNKNEKS